MPGLRNISVHQHETNLFHALWKERIKRSRVSQQRLTAMMGTASGIGLLA
jgi:hypothetical protein